MRRPTRPEVLGLATGTLLFGAAAFIRSDRVLVVGWIALVGAATGLAVVIDVRERRIPNLVTYNGTLLAIAIAAAAGLPGVASSIGGAVVGGGLMTVAVVVGRGGLGLGDAKFSTFAGATLGVAGVVPYLVISVTAGALVGICLLLLGRGRRASFAFGPALAVGLLLTILAGGSVLG